MNQGANTIPPLYSATPFLDAFGHVVIARLWLHQALVALQALQSGAQNDAGFYEGKVTVCQFFIAITSLKPRRSLVTWHPRTGQCSIRRQVASLASDQCGSGWGTTKCCTPLGRI